MSMRMSIVDDQVNETIWVLQGKVQIESKLAESRRTIYNSQVNVSC